jgi:collagenase-like PrtC family protease
MSTALSLGPVFFNWPPEKLRDFYFRIADEAPVDIVHVGDVVCFKRAPFFAPHLPDVIERLQAGGKQVVLSSLALIANDREWESVRDLVAAAELPVEINDLSLALLVGGKPHVVGPFVNVYNECTLDCLARRGADRVCLPPELPAASLAALAAMSPVPLEVLVFGRIPLAISARCYHARAHGLHKDGCRFVCGRDPDGLAVRTLDGESFLAVNGTQTLSHRCLNLAGEIDVLRDMGFATFRLSPQDCDMGAVARLFRDLLDGRTDGPAALETLPALMPEMPFANGFFHGMEGLRFRQGDGHVH